MQICLFDTPLRENLLPFTHTRSIADIRCGILTLRERWEHYFGVQHTDTLTVSYLQSNYPSLVSNTITYINGSVHASAALKTAIIALESGQALFSNELLIAYASLEPINSIEDLLHKAQKAKKNEYAGHIDQLCHIWDIFTQNGAQIKADFKAITAERNSASLPHFVQAINPEAIFIEEGAILMPCIINASNGPVYIGKHAEIMEGALLRGPIAIGAHSTIKMGAKIYGDTTIGPGCKIGGEVSNSVFFENSNKGHDGFIGNSVVGAWCNFGADTNCSNLKNNYSLVSIFNEAKHEMQSTGLQFCGLFMGDHSKTGINTMINTGTVIGVACNIFGSEFPEKYIPSFTWGIGKEATAHKIDKAIATAQAMMQRRQQQLNEAAIAILHYISNNVKR
jgi:UDP-N-acetylglucosamine diphosphorylase/glucosamine-1-phosphate N-acetyltransferase